MNKYNFEQKLVYVIGISFILKWLHVKGEILFLVLRFALNQKLFSAHQICFNFKNLIHIF